MKCNAPLNNMYFTVKGNVSPCWLTTTYVDNWSEDRSIRDIWFGEKFQAIRDNLKNHVYEKKCLLCKTEHDQGVWPLAKAYAHFPVKEYPSLMELELSNQCNLECIMCNGTLSSGIRKNRDKLPPLPMIYTPKFVEELKEFIPHLEELRFNGGEPFAQKIVLDICDMVAEINPGLKINVATNGMIYNKRVKKIMAQNNLHLNISIDSLQSERYREIRINGDLNTVLVNFSEFNRYCKENDRELSIMVNPMRNNWEEMVDFVEFCNNEGVNLWFNTIREPKHLSLWNLDCIELWDIHDALVEQMAKLNPESKNYPVFRHFVTRQIRNWLMDKILENGHNSDTITG